MNSCFSDVTLKYLTGFHKILDNMICAMTSASLNGSISHNFIVQMIPHHEAAIEMSQSILQYTTLVPLQQIAQNIVTEQTESIASMKNALCACDEIENTPDELMVYQLDFKHITETMFCRMRNAVSTNRINANFMREMIPHHEGAIRMSKNALRFAICPELKPILKAIVTSQEKGVMQMQNLLSCINS